MRSLLITNRCKFELSAWCTKPWFAGVHYTSRIFFRNEKGRVWCLFVNGMRKFVRDFFVSFDWHCWFGCDCAKLKRFNYFQLLKIAWLAMTFWHLWGSRQLGRLRPLYNYVHLHTLNISVQFNLRTASSSVVKIWRYWKTLGSWLTALLIDKVGVSAHDQSVNLFRRSRVTSWVFCFVLFCHSEISQTVCPRVMYLVPSESPWGGGVHRLYFVAFRPTVGKLLNFKVLMSYKN